MPGRQYDPNKIAKSFTIMVKTRQFIHEDNEFDDLFEKAETFSHVLHLASIKIDPSDLNKFHIYRNRRLKQVPLDLLQIE